MAIGADEVPAELVGEIQNDIRLCCRLGSTLLIRFSRGRNRSCYSGCQGTFDEMTFCYLSVLAYVS